MPSFFFHELRLITALLLICDSSMNWSTRFTSLKLCVEFSIFDSVSFLTNFIFVFNEMYELFDFKTSQFLSKLNRKATHSFAPRPLLFKLQQEVWKKTYLMTNFLNPENWSLENVSIVTIRFIRPPALMLC